MFLSEPFWKEELYSDDIEKKIKENIDEISSHSDWNHLDLALNIDNLDLPNKNDVEVRQRRDIYENIAKLSVDIWRDYNYYKQFGFESRYANEEYKAKLIELGFVCGNGRWQCASKPRFEIVAKNVFAYCILQRMCANVEPAKERICFYCDFPYPMDAETCTVCYHKFTSEKDNILQTSAVDCGTKAFDSGYGPHSPMDAKKDGDQNEIIESPTGDKWKCYRCTRLNDIDSVNCSECYHSRNIPTDTKPGKEWVCSNCTNINAVPALKCKMCGFDRPPSDNQEVSCFLSSRLLASSKFQSELLQRYKWECNKCHCINVMNQMNCEGCTGNINEDCRWKCNQCGLFNKIGAQKCDACKFENEVVADYNNRNSRCSVM